MVGWMGGGVMEVTWTEDSDLVSRIDAEFYRHEFVALLQRLTNHHVAFKPFHKIWKQYNRIYIGIAGFDEVADTSQYTPYLRPVDISDEGFIDYDNLPWCKKEWLDEYGRNGCAQSGDLIVEVKGNTQKVAVVSNRIPANCIVSGSAYRIQIKDGYDPYFIQAFLLSGTGQSLKRRFCSNTTISYIDPESFRNLLIPDLEYKLQHTIGNKARKADRLRELARVSWHTSVVRLENAIGVELTEDHFKSFHPADISAPGYFCVHTKPSVSVTDPSDVLAAQYFHPRRILARQVAMRAPRSDRLITVARRVRKKTANKAIRSNTFIGLDAIDSATGIISQSTYADSDGQSGICFASGDILFSRLRPYLNKVAIWPQKSSPGIGSGELLVYSAKDIDPYYLFFVLKSNVCLKQVVDVTSGSTHPRVDEEVVDDILVPRFNTDIESSISDAVRNAHQYWYGAMSDIARAKDDVEGLLAGRINEASLLTESDVIEKWLAANPSPSTGGAV
jgi:type I restriction enzyme, S subunit